jgi:primase-polymerase (primpol)-like protein
MTGDAIPAELRARPQWIVWRYEQRDGKRTKVPYEAVDPQSRASSTDPDTWSAYAYAVKAVERGAADGVGFVFSPDDPYCGVDLDACRDPATGKVHPAAARIVLDLDSYTEVSPSGTGLHVIACAVLPGERHSTSKTPWDGKLEIYDQARFFTMTGQVCRIEQGAHRG